MRELGYVARPAGARAGVPALVPDRPGLRQPERAVHRQHAVRRARRAARLRLRAGRASLRQHAARTTSTACARFAQQQKLHGVILVPRVSEDQALADMLREIGCRYVRIAVGPARRGRAHGRDPRPRGRGAKRPTTWSRSATAHIGLITGPRRYRSALERGAGFLEGAGRARRRAAGASTSSRAATPSSPASPAAEQLLALDAAPDRDLRLQRRDGRRRVQGGACAAACRSPSDLSVVGFDDSPLASRLWPALTTVRLPIRDMGRQAAAMLLAASRRAGT